MQGIKVALVQTGRPTELIAGRYDPKTQEACYTVDGVEKKAESFVVVDGYVLPKSMKAADEDAVGN